MANLEYTLAESGTIHIAEDVIQTIAGVALSEIDGVAKMGGSAVSGLAEQITGRRNLTRGVKVEFSNESQACTLTVQVVLRYGVRIPDVAAQIQEHVQASVEQYTGLRVAAVHVHVVGLSLREEDDESEGFGLPGKVSNLIQQGTDLVKQGYDTAKNKVQSAAQATKDAAAEAIGTAKEKTQQGVEAVKDAAQSAYQASKDAAQQGAETVKDAANRAAEATKDAAQKAAEATKNTVEQVKDKVTSNAEVTPSEARVEDAKQTVKEGVESAKDAVQRGLEQAKEAVERGADAAKDAADRAADKAKDQLHE
ncbi:MAG: Asp23/Gls24 family envelope stress response protein [Alicyclobacillus sp.]|nr:Asp23/Gls24 family envelope stress response protein [Alicyclobacillus sp.]